MKPETSEPSAFRLNLAVSVSQMFRDTLEEYHAAPNTLRTGLTDPEMHALNRRTTQRTLDLLYSIPNIDFGRDGPFMAAHLLDAALLGYGASRIHVGSDDLNAVLRNGVALFACNFERRAAFFLERRLLATLDRDFKPSRIEELSAATWQILASASQAWLQSAKGTWSRTRRSKRWREFAAGS